MDKVHRKFSDIRAASKKDGQSVVDLAILAFKQIRPTPEGQAIYEYLAMISASNRPVPSESAWMEEQARRLFAEQILQFMEGDNGERKRQHRSGPEAE